MQFPHLSDTSFPDLPTVNVYQFQNTFDYSRWNEKSKIKLCNVLWNSEYADVVKFDTDLQRDTWFDSLDDIWTLELRTSARIVPEGFVKLPVPYDVMARYNYLFVDMPIATSEEHQIDYENNGGIRRWYFFVNDIKYLSPNATQVYLLPDVWTNFQNRVSIPYMMLERGHAPVAASSVDTYLANPIANNRYLLAPDVNFDNAGITRSSTFVPFGNGTKYVCIASTCAPDQITSLGSVVVDPDYSPGGTITYSDVNARYGYQLQVNGLTLGNGRDYSSTNTPAKMGTSNGIIANNLSVYAIAASEVYGNGATFFTDVIEQCPQFLNTVRACFVVDENCITLGSIKHMVAGHALYACVGKSQNLLTKVFTKADFNFPQELQRFAKLYTAPYSQVEITDNDGTTYTVNVEETGTLSVNSVVSVAFPYINERVYIDGIGGSGSKSYSWVDLRNNTSALQMSNADWFKYCFDWQIPTFALYMDGETAFMLESFNRNVKQSLRQEIVNYHNTMRSANTAYENACDTADVAYTNTTDNAETARDNAYRSADTGKTNTDAAADTQCANTYNSAGTARTNAKNDADTAKTNADNSADTAKTNADNTAIVEYDIVDRNCTNQSDNLDLANAATADNEEDAMYAEIEIAAIDAFKQDATTQYSNSLVMWTASQNVEASTSSTQSTAIGEVVGSAVTGAATGATFGSFLGPEGTLAGAGGGAIIGAVGGGIHAVTSIVNNGITTNTAQTISDAQRQANTDIKDVAVACAIRGTPMLTTTVTNVKIDTRTAIYQRNIQCSEDQMDNSNRTDRANGLDRKNNAITNATNTQNTAKTNAANNKTTEYTNADNAYDTVTTNADNLQTVTKANATRTKDTARANAGDTYTTTETCADRTRDNVKDNAGYTRQVSELNAKEILENGKYAAMASVLDARNAPPVEVCKYSGNPAPDYMKTRGVQIKVKTQSDSAIRQTGDVFARFGYALNQVWDVATSGLKLMNHFTYWKASEIWVNDEECSNNVINTFVRNMFLNGVTVWNDPTKIGKVNVYTN